MVLMKKFVSLFTLAALLLSSFIIPSFAEEPLLGVWYANMDHPTEIPQDVLDAFHAATESTTGYVYKPIALLGSQVVAGMNYCLLCETTLAVPDAQPCFALVYFCDGVNGEKEVLKVDEIEFCAYYTLDGE